MRRLPVESRLQGKQCEEWHRYRRCGHALFMGASYWPLVSGGLYRRLLGVEKELNDVTVADLVVAADGPHPAAALDLVQITGLDELVG